MPKLPPLPKGKVNVGEKMTPHYSASQMHDYASEYARSYAAQEVAKEREACAKGCDDALDGFTESSDWATGYVTAVKDIADGIRSRKD